MVSEKSRIFNSHQFISLNKDIIEIFKLIKSIIKTTKANINN